MWLFTHIFLLGFKGYALYLFFGGTLSLYLQLRYEVDGTDEEEIDPHIDEDDDEGPDGSQPKWVGDAPAATEGDAAAADAPAAESPGDTGESAE
ncbi:MAG: hypothetical protein OER88_03660, partial [Planctomycetota bacterium]|nr:hypothetical protein [Planctomycetota bacterium]